MGSFRSRVAAWEHTLVGKVALSALRAFVGVFIAAEANIFNAFISLVTNHTNADFGVLKNLLLALVAAGVTAAIRAVQHYFFETPTAA